MTARLQRPARDRRKVFQPLEKKFPIIGKNGRNFPTIGKIFSNHWKKTENFFQSLENRRKIFPIVGKLLRVAALCGCLVLAVPAAYADMCTRLDVGVGKNGGELVVSFNGIENDRPAMAALLGKVLQKDPGLMCSLFVAPDVTMEELAEVVTWIHGIGFKAFEIFGYSREPLAIRMEIGECETFSNPDDVLEELEPPVVLPPEVDGTVPLDSEEGGAP